MAVWAWLLHRDGVIVAPHARAIWPHTPPPSFRSPVLAGSMVSAGSGRSNPGNPWASALASASGDDGVGRGGGGGGGGAGGGGGSGGELPGPGPSVAPSGPPATLPPAVVILLNRVPNVAMGDRGAAMADVASWVTANVHRCVSAGLPAALPCCPRHAIKGKEGEGGRLVCVENRVGAAVDGLLFYCDR